MKFPRAFSSGRIKWLFPFLTACGTPLPGGGSPAILPPEPTGILVAEWGQSNAESATSLPTADRAWTGAGDNPGRVRFAVSDGTNWATGTGTATLAGTLGNSFVPFANYQLGGTTRFLPAAAFVRALLARGVPASAVVVSQGSTSVASDLYWKAPNGPLLKLFIAEMHAALSDPTNPIAGNIAKIVIFSSIGEADGALQSTAQTFGANYQAIQEKLIAEFPGYPVSFVISKLHPISSPAFTALIRAAEQTIADERADTQIVETARYQLNSDALHWSVEINAAISQDAARLVLPEISLHVATRGFTANDYFDSNSGVGPQGSAEMAVVGYVRTSGAHVTGEQVVVQSYGLSGQGGYRLLLEAPQAAGNAIIRAVVTSSAGVEKSSQVEVSLEPGIVEQVGLRLSGGFLQLFCRGTPLGTPVSVTGFKAGGAQGRLRIGRVSPGNSDVQIIAVQVAGALTNQQFSDHLVATLTSDRPLVLGALGAWFAECAGGDWTDEIGKAVVKKVGGPSLILW